MTKRFRLPVAALTCLAVVAGVIFYVRAQSPGPDLPVKDPNAVAILDRAAAAMGARLLRNAADTVATGALTVYLPDGQTSSGTITLLTGGADQYRTEIDEGGSLRSVTVSSGEAWSERNGTSFPLSREAATDIRPEHLPQLSKWKRSGLPSFGVHYAGTETLDGSGAQVYVIDLEDTSPEQVQNLSTRGASGQQLSGQLYRLYIDTSSFLVRKVAFTRGAEGNPTARAIVENLYGDYRQFGSVMAPFRIERQVSGRTASLITLSSFTISAGVDAGKFAPPLFAQAGGGQ